MQKLNNGNLKLAIQKKGRLSEDSIEFLRKAGLEFESYNKSLFASCRNFPLEILFVRDDDIPDYVATGVVDLGIVGQNLLNELQAKVKKLLNLRYCFCSLCLCVPKDSTISDFNDLNAAKVATSYPNSTKYFLQKNNINAKVITINGSVEATPVLGVANAIVDLVSTGSTLSANDLKIICKLYDSEAILISNINLLTNKKKNVLVNKLLTRFKGVLSAKNYKYVMMNAPEKMLSKINKTIPGLKSPTISPLASRGWISIQSVIKEDVFWETIEKLKKIGATGILVLPVEKLIL